MTSIGHVDQVLLLLREQLRRMERKKGAAAPRSDRSGPTRPMARLQAIATVQALSDEDVERSLVYSLLLEQFGEAIANDPKFQTVIDDVVRLIRSNPDTRSVLGQSVRQLRAGDESAT